jgi:histidinol-phosphate aminotransferase
VGYGVGASEVIELMQRVRQPFNVNAVAQWAALAAIDDEEHVQRTLKVNRDGMEYLNGEIHKLGLQQVPSQANFVLIRVGNGNEIFQRLLAEGVIVRPMAVYALPEFIRVTIGTMDENRRFVLALKKILQVR